MARQCELCLCHGGKLERIDVCAYTMVFILAALPQLCFILAFSAMGYGEDFWDFLRQRQDGALYFASAGVGQLLVMYIFDFSYWKGVAKQLRGFGMTILVISLMIGAGLSAKKYPSTPMLVFICGNSFFFWFVRQHYPFSHLSHPQFLLGVAYSLAVISLAVLIAWGYWLAAGNNWWSEETKEEFSRRMNCDYSNRTKDVMGEMIQEDCLGALLLWFAPCIFALCNFVTATVVHLFGLHLRSLNKQRNDGDRVDKAMYMIEAFLVLIVLLLVGIWMASAVAAGSMQISNLVVMFSIAALCSSAVLMGSIAGFHGLIDTVSETHSMKVVFSVSQNNWCKALVVVAFFPVVPFYLLLSFLNQVCRRTMTRLTKAQYAHFCAPDALAKPLTATTMAQLHVLRKWNWTNVLLCVAYTNLIYLVLVVGVGKITTVLLTALNEYLSSFRLFSVCVLYVMIGLFMFLNPFIPGIPVYLTGGIVITRRAEAAIGFGYGALLCCGVCWLIKLMSVAIQHKCIGENMSKYVWVRRIVGVNTNVIRATKIIMQKPDWPTTVFTGILRLNVMQMVLGSSPVIFLVVPCCVSGALLLRYSEGGNWQSLANVMLAVAAMVQAMAILIAFSLIQRTYYANRDKFEDWPVDEEVLASQEQYREKAQLLLRLTSWHSDEFPMPGLVRLCLILSAAGLTISSYIITFAQEECFEPYDISDSIDVQLHGDPLNVVRPLGWKVARLLLAACVPLVLYHFWRWCRLYTYYRKSHQAKQDSGGQTVKPLTHSASARSLTSADGDCGTDDYSDTDTDVDSEQKRIVKNNKGKDKGGMGMGGEMRDLRSKAPSPIVTSVTSAVTSVVSDNLTNLNLSGALSGTLGGTLGGTSTSGGGGPSYSLVTREGSLGSTDYPSSPDSSPPTPMSSLTPTTPTRLGLVREAGDENLNTQVDLTQGADGMAEGERGAEVETENGSLLNKPARILV